MAKKVLTKQDGKKQINTTFIILMIISVVILVAGIVLACIEATAGIGLIALFVGIIFLAVTLWKRFWVDRKRLKRSFCDSCEAKYDYENDIGWEVGEVQDSGNRQVAVVEFTCRCPQCGKERSFQEKFQIAYYNKDKDRWEEKNIRTLARKYFIN